MKTKLIVLTVVALTLAGSAPGQTIDPALTPEEIKAIAKDAFFWGMTPAGAYEMRYLYTQLESAKREGFAAGMRQFTDMNGWKLTSSWNADYDDYPVMGYWGLAALFGPIPYYSHTTAATYTDADGQPLDAAHRYTLTFDVKNLPPVTDFWEIAMYDPNGYFIDNELNRYAVNSYMYQNGDFVVKNGQLTFYLQQDKPTDPDQAKNWLPAAGKFHLPVRFYGPTAPVIDGSYAMPKVVRVK